MTYRAFGALTPEQQQMEKAALEQLPSCYSNAFHRCYADREMSAFPNCELFDEVYRTTGEEGALEKRVETLPFCPEPSDKPVRAGLLDSPAPLVVALAAGVGLGYVVWGYKR